MAEKTWYGLWPVKRRLFMPFFYRFELLLAVQKQITEYLPEPGPAADVSEELLREVLSADPNRAPTPLEAYRRFFAVVSLLDRPDRGIDFPSVLRLECVLLRCIAVMDESLTWHYGPMGLRERRRRGLQLKYRSDERERGVIRAAESILKARNRKVSRRELARLVTDKMTAQHANGAGPEPYAETRMLEIFARHLPPEVFAT